MANGGKVIAIVLIIGVVAAGGYYLYSKQVKAKTGSAPSTRTGKKTPTSAFPGVPPSGLERFLQGDAEGAWNDFLEIFGVKQVQKDLGV